MRDITLTVDGSDDTVRLDSNGGIESVKCSGRTDFEEFVFLAGWHRRALSAMVTITRAEGLFGGCIDGTLVAGRTVDSICEDYNRERGHA